MPGLRSKANPPHIALVQRAAERQRGAQGKLDCGPCAAPYLKVKLGVWPSGADGLEGEACSVALYMTERRGTRFPFRKMQKFFLVGLEV